MKQGSQGGECFCTPSSDKRRRIAPNIPALAAFALFWFWVGFMARGHQDRDCACPAGHPNYHEHVELATLCEQAAILPEVTPNNQHPTGVKPSDPTPVSSNHRCP